MNAERSDEERQRGGMAGTLHHVEINVADLGRTSAFWGWLLADLGYRKYQEWDGGVSWKLEGTYLVFVQAHAPHLEAGYHRSRVGLNHLAFHARSRAHVDAVAAELERRGVPLLYRDRHPHAGGPAHYAVFFEDPDRIKVELVAPERS